MRLPGIHETGFDGIVTEVGLALIAVKGEEWSPAGSAVIIAPRLAITAKHVVDGCWRHFEEHRKLQFGDLHGDFGLIAVQGLSEKQGALWAVRKLWCSPHSDIAVLQLEPYSESAKTYRWRCPILRVQPPRNGAEVHCFGFRGGAAIATTTDQTISVNWKTSPSTSFGRVVEVHPRQRERGMLTFPCFRINAPFASGMSGGPIFVNGMLSGLICSGGNQMDGNGEHVSYGVTLWPLMATKLELNVTGYPPGTCFTVFQLAQRGFLRVLDLHTITVRDDGSGEQVFETVQQ